MGDEAEVAALVRGGDVTAACERLYQRYSAEVTRFVALSVGRAAKRQDVCQEVWVAVQKALPAFRFESALRTWVLHIARHKIIDGWRDRTLEETLGSELADGVGLPLRSSSRRSTPSRLLHEKQRAQVLKRALAELDGAERELLEMRYVLGLKPGEISHVLGDVASNTVSQRIVRIVRRLHSRLRDEEALESFRRGRS
jgi:RNA polymerase sigma-70 factor, ECF subfamily